jgi:hypothetical protein
MIVQDGFLPESLVEALWELEEVWRLHLGDDGPALDPGAVVVPLGKGYAGYSGEVAIGSAVVGGETCVVVSEPEGWSLADCALAEGSTQVDLALFPIVAGDPDAAFGLFPGEPSGNRAVVGQGEPLFQVRHIRAEIQGAVIAKTLPALSNVSDKRSQAFMELILEERMWLALAALLGLLPFVGFLRRKRAAVTAREATQVTVEEQPDLIKIEEGPQELSETRDIGDAAPEPVAHFTTDGSRILVTPPPGPDVVGSSPAPRHVRRAHENPRVAHNSPPNYQPTFGGRPLAPARKGLGWLAGEGWSRALRKACRHHAKVGSVHLLEEGRGVQAVWRLTVPGSWQELAAVVYTHRSAAGQDGVPGSADEHEALLERLVAFEMGAWKAMALGQGIAKPATGFEVLPLASIRGAWHNLPGAIAVVHDGQEWEGYLRPYVPWPSLAQHALPEEVLRKGLQDLLDGLANAPETIGPLTDVRELMEDLRAGKWRTPGRLGRRMVLVNPNARDAKWPLLLPTQWRPFHRTWRDALHWSVR